MAHHHQESRRFGGQCHGRFYSHVANLFFLGYRCVAFVVSSFIFWLQLGAAKALFGSTIRWDVSKRADKRTLCSTLHLLNGKSPVVGFRPSRLGAGQRSFPSAPLSHDLGQHTARTSSTETNHD